MLFFYPPPRPSFFNPFSPFLPIFFFFFLFPHSLLCSSNLPQPFPSNQQTISTLPSSFPFPPFIIHFTHPHPASSSKDQQAIQHLLLFLLNSPHSPTLLLDSLQPLRCLLFSFRFFFKKHPQHL